jgi:hypothetical protein
VAEVVDMIQQELLAVQAEAGVVVLLHQVEQELQVKVITVVMVIQL